MKIFNSIYTPKNCKRASIAIGNFDGTHKGHQKIFKYAQGSPKKIRLNLEF